ncbi:MAG: hypothetical protein PHO02_04005 [Candidatus Nanoarchaeia archaeon]|nr:hypothetical protein [Candidatus Nanoarchaeia archaeon]
MTLEDKAEEKEILSSRIRLNNMISRDNSPNPLFGNDVINEIASLKAEYTIIGETHPDESVESLVMALISTGKYSTLFLEALCAGDYAEKGDELKRGVYDWNPAKYDRIIRYAAAQGVEVHGIDIPRFLGGTSEDIAKWADYIALSKNGKSIILTGDGHATYRNSEISLPCRLAEKKVLPQDIVTIGEFPKCYVPEGKVFRKSEIEDMGGIAFPGIKTSDYIFIRPLNEAERRDLRCVLETDPYSRILEPNIKKKKARLSSYTPDRSNRTYGSEE